VYRRVSTLALRGGAKDTLDVDLDHTRPCPSGPRADRSRLRYIDLETTGLSGGAGTVAFLAGAGRLLEGGLEIEQLLLADYCYEPGFLEAFAALIPDGAIVASYNGRAFDMRLLETRMRMNGMRPREYEQLDLYHPARRLFGGPRGASLKDIEASVLGIERVGDPPGASIPGIWIAALGRGSYAGLEAVVAHHAQDIASLAMLHAAMDGILSRGTGDAPLGIPCLRRAGLARILDARGRHEEALSCLREGARADELACLRVLARREAREGRPSVNLRRRAFELSGTAKDGVALAKALEWEEGSFAEALRLVDSLASRADIPRELEEGLKRRRARLARKAERE
jgi:hypothetical protein